MPIQLLPPQLANQIAAGEVVERPASVVKELIENSLDAGASKIELDIEKGGHKRIRIRDNGSGIEQSELSLALSRHATSKIATLDDLEQILSLGFRGEALASISSVSRLTLTSKPAHQEQAWQAHCEGRDMAVKLNPVAHPDGTTIDVADLFYNTPARRKFLRTEKTEYQHIEDVVRRIALSHPHVGFVLKHNGKVVKRYQVSTSEPLTQRIASVMGQKFLANAIYLNTDYHGMTMEAWLGNEAMLRSSTDCQFSFVNGRGMRDKLILHAIRQAYESVWGVLEQPSFVVYLSVNPRDVDVNVHPAKHEVRFQQSRLVHDFICKAVADALADEHESASAQREEPAHDYIRPLQNVNTYNSSDDSPQYQPKVAQPIAERQMPAYSSPMPTSGKSGRSYGNAGSVARAGENYSSLMTATGAEPSTTKVDYLQLSEYVRIYLYKNACWLFDMTSILDEWVGRKIGEAQLSQPLLMPVSVAADMVSEQNLTVLKGLGFEINKAAGKVILQQVPAGCRHFPWVKWFPAMLASNQHSIEGVLTSIKACEGIPADVSASVWYDIDNMPRTEFIDMLTRAGRQQALENVIDGWPQ